jgi:hypothetical protein
MPQRHDEWDAVYLSNHAARFTRPQAWFESAIELAAAAEALSPLVIAWWDSLKAWQDDKSEIFNEHSYHQIFLMLYAFAIENYCKGTLAGRLDWSDRIALQSQGKFPKHMKTHDLFTLTNNIGFAPSLEDEELLRRLTHAAVWTGRYPVSTHFEGTYKVKFSDGKHYHLSYIGRDDVERVRDLADRIRTLVGARVSYRISSRRDETNS